jgi:CRP-like cAMP-binding protein
MDWRSTQLPDLVRRGDAVAMTERPKQSAAKSEPLLDPARREALLRRSFIFKDLPPELLAGLAQIASLRRLEDGQLLFQQGDEGDALFAVVDGLIRISVVGRGGKAFTLALMEPGDVFGEIALLDGLSRTATAEAAADSLLLVIERAAFLAVLERDGRLARHIIELLCDRLRENTDRLSEFAFLDLGARLAGKLQALAIAHGRDTQDGVRIALKLSQTELAEMLGVTREAINKQLKAWSKQNLLRVERGFITVIDKAGLAAFARSDDDED